MDRHNRGGDRDGNRHYSRMSGRSSSDRYPNPNNSHHHQQPNYRGGGGGGGFSEPHNTRPFNNSHHHNHNQPFGGAPDFRPTAADGGSGGGGFGGGGFSGGGFGGGFQSGPMSGQKRSITGGFPSSGRSHSPNRGDSGNFAKLFIGSVPRTATEEDIRPLFEDQGNVIEVALIKDKRTGQQQGPLKRG